MPIKDLSLIFIYFCDVLRSISGDLINSKQSNYILKVYATRKLFCVMQKWFTMKLLVYVFALIQRRIRSEFSVILRIQKQKH